MSTDCDDIIFVEEVGPSTSSAVIAGSGRDRARAAASRPQPKPAPSQCTSSSVLLTTWLETARREAATTRRLDARRKAAGVTSPAKRPKMKKEGQKTQGEIDTVTLGEPDIVELDDDQEEFVKGEVALSSMVTGSLVTAPPAAILAARSPNKPSPASSQESRSSSRRGRATSASQEGSQENDGELAGSQEARAEFVRELMRVDDGREETRASLRDGDVIRNRADRAAMHGQDCPCCSEYYDHLEIDDEERKRRIDQVSRHRYVARPMPRTPPHYWDMDFPSEKEQEERGMINKRYENPVEKSEDAKEEEDNETVEQSDDDDDTKKEIKEDSNE